MSDELLLLEQAFGAEPIGLETNAVRWLQQLEQFLLKGV